MAKDADHYERYLERNPDKALMCINNDDTIHHFEWDDGLTFVAHNAHGYDYNGSRAALEEAVTAPIKIVDHSDLHQEREQLVDGEWETIESWASDGIHA